MAAVRGQLDPKTLDADRRAGNRRKLRLAAYGSTSSERTDVLLLDVSTTGVLLQAAGELSEGETIELELPGQSGAPAVVKWSSGNLFGCEFKQPVSDAFVSAALLRSPHLLPISQLPEPLRATTADDEQDAPNLTKLSGAMRLQILIGATLLIWSVIAVVAFVLLG